MARRQRRGCDIAGSWIKVDTTITTRPQVVRIASALKRTISDTIGACVVFWCAATEQGIDGDLPEWDDSVVDTLVGIDGFAKALRSVGWLTDLAGDRVGLQVPKWQDHNAASAKRLALDRERKRKDRLGYAKRPHSVRKASASSPHNNGQHSPSVSVSDDLSLSSGEGSGEGPTDGDPWAKPKTVHKAPAKAAVPDSESVGEVRKALIDFGFNPSEAYNHAKHKNATPERVLWLIDEAKARLAAGDIDSRKALGFVVWGIKEAKDPNPGPAVETPEQRRTRVLTENAKKIWKDET